MKPRSAVSRRGLLQFASALLPLRALIFTAAALGIEGVAAQENHMPVADVFPATSPELVREMVTVAHFDLNRVKELCEARPSLAEASWDWGFGDHESALGAASHMGNRPIAEYLISKGARVSIFSAAMFGELDVVKGFITAHPGVQRTHGPHSISLLAHARMGGEKARPVLEYLQSLGDADTHVPVAMSDSEIAALSGTYTFGLGIAQAVDVDGNIRMYVGTKMYTHAPQLNWTRKGTMPRPLFHLGGNVFFPGGAPAVRVRFAENAGAMVMTVTDGDLEVTARKQKSA